MVEKFGISQPVRRREDTRFLTGRGTFADDINHAGQAYASFVRAQVPHGRIRGIDTTAAANAPGVVGIFTGADLVAAGMHGQLPRALLPGFVTTPTPRPGLADTVVRHVGEPVAVVIAETRAQADDAADLVAVDVEERPAAIEITDARTPGAPVVWPDAPGNVCQEWTHGDRDAADRAFADATHVTRLKLRNNRVVVNPMEVRTSLAEHDAAADRYTLTCSSQGVHYMHEVLSEQILRIPGDKLRIRTHDVGGGFGVKEQPYPEDVAILFAAKVLGRPVKWTGSRAEHFLSDNQARDADIDAALALDDDGNFLAIRVTVDDAMGAYYAGHGPFISVRNMTNGLPLVYRTPVLDITVRLVFTHTGSVGPYRGAGREQAALIVERLIDEAARETGRDALELRRINYVPSTAMPYETPAGRTYDSGEFEAVLDKALIAADWAGFPARRAASEAAGKVRGRGLASCLECVGAVPFEGAILRFNSEDNLDLVVASQSQGQGHETSFVQVVADRLGLPFDAITLHQGDSDDVPIGLATIGSRSMIMTGSAIANTCDAVIEKGRELAAHILEAATADIEFADGEFRVTGTDRKIELLALAKTVRTLRAAPDSLPEGVPDSLDSEEEFRAQDQYFPNGCHICEVEIDPSTGEIEVESYVAVDDVGTVVNPMIVHGQVHGGVVQGIGQALLENSVYDKSGQLLTGSLMDYPLPRARHVPNLVTDFHPVPSPANPLGVKGIGEAGLVGALPTVMNAIADALATRGCALDFDMPATPEKIWRALSGQANT
ncbi:MAG: xanthine dehydrogenase family protein molybdopterin-binding subunit [Alphaproteobacteria bacterium]